MNQSTFYYLLRRGAFRGKGSSFVGPLDEFGVPVVAFSLQRLLSSYEGAAIRVRRTGGDEADIGFTADGQLDLAALAAFCTTGNGRLVTLYNQGSGANIGQSTAVAQPLVYNAGVPVLKDGKPAIHFDGLGEYLTTSGTEDFGLHGTDPISAFVRASLDVTNTTQNLFATGLTASSSAAFMQFSLRFNVTRFEAEVSDGITDFNVGNDTVPSAGAPFTSSVIADVPNGTAQIYIDGTATRLSETIGTTINDASYPFNIGRDPFRNGFFLEGNMQELIIYKSLPSRTGIEASIANRY